jgi:GNAT superfamily N-acetyltransferase
MAAASPEAATSAAAHPRPAGVAVEALDLRRSRARRRFIEVARRLHAAQANYVSPIIRDRMWFLDPERNPTAEGLELQAFVAHRAGGEVGRLLAFVDPDRGSCGCEEPTGFFGFYDAADDPDVTRALLDRARRWLRARGCLHVEGPIDLGIEHGGGVLVQGNERPPVVGAAWNPPGYDALLQGAGLSPSRDLLSWGWQLDDAAATTHLLDRAQRTRGRARIRVRAADTQHLEAELADWHAIFNASQRDRGGCAPVRRRVFDALAYDLTRIALDDLILFAEVDGRPVGVAVTVPDVNPLLPRSGRLFPFTWLKLHRRRCAVTRGRMRWLSVHPDFRGQGVETVLLAETARAARGIGMRRIDVCWTGEDDHAVNREIRQLGARLDRRFRVYRGRTAP